MMVEMRFVLFDELLRARKAAGLTQAEVAGRRLCHCKKYGFRLRLLNPWADESAFGNLSLCQS